jgi:NitT/TauT family transport system substrate-binding protein
MKRSTFVAAAAAAGFSPRLAAAQTLIPVRIGTIATESYALSIYAKQQGFFDANGIDAQVQYMASASGGITSALVGGALDVGCASMGAASNAFLRGIGIEVIAGGAIISSRHPATMLVVAKDSPVMSPRDLNGKVVGVSALRDVINVAEAKFIDQHGGDSKTISFIELTPSSAPAALTARRIDAYALSEPTLTFSRDQLRPLGAIYDALGQQVMISVHLAKKDWLDANPETGRRVVRALRQAAQWANANPTDAATIISREAKIPLEVVAKMNHVTFGESVTPGALQPQIDALAQYGFIERKYPASDIIWPGAKSA